jgi:hypothetical protein
MTDQIESRSKDALLEYYRLEMKIVSDRINAFENFRIQSASFFGTLSFAGIGIALSTQKAGIILLSSIFLLCIIFIDYGARRTLAFYYYRGLQLQKKLAPDDDETFLRILPGGLYDSVRSISNIEDRENRYTQLCRIPFTNPSLIGFWFPFFSFLAEISVGLIFWVFYRWQLF